MIEVFKTNIICPQQADRLVELIHKTFTCYRANFDLDDCDKLLRVVNNSGNIPLPHFIEWLKKYNCNVEVLPDN